LAAKPFVEIQRNEFITPNFSARLSPSTSWAISRLPISEFGLNTETKRHREGREKSKVEIENL
jgi:hypothetical protein